jgi:hypothetical protein
MMLTGDRTAGALHPVLRGRHESIGQFYVAKARS